jgi:adenylyl-sulfate kinase
VPLLRVIYSERGTPAPRPTLTRPGQTTNQRRHFSRSDFANRRRVAVSYHTTAMRGGSSQSRRHIISRLLRAMADLSRLVELLYGAHRDVDGLFIEAQDRTTSDGNDVVIAQTNVGGGVTFRWIGQGPNQSPAKTIRRLWLQHPDRVRAEVVQGEAVVRAAVRNGDAWWRWDRHDGESAGTVSQGATLPAMLDAGVLVSPARLLATTWFEVTGVSNRGTRSIIAAKGTPRSTTGGGERHFEFEFDLEHGTPLYIATLDAGTITNVTETLSVEYEPTIDAEIFMFQQRAAAQVSAAAQPGSTRHHHLPNRVAPTGVASSALPPAILARHSTIWLTGLSGAGKTTIARATERLLHQLGVRCCVIDGDELRNGLSSDLGLSRDDRAEQARRAAHIATIVADSGVVPIVALVSPYAADRQRARAIHEEAGIGLLEVWVDTPLEVCAARDTKGLYAAASAAIVAPHWDSDGSGLTGLASPYEAPSTPDVHVRGDEQQPRAAAVQIVEKMISASAQAHVVSTNMPRTSVGFA